MSAIDVDAINPILKKIIKEETKPESKTSNNKRFARIRRALGRKVKRVK